MTTQADGDPRRPQRFLILLVVGMALLCLGCFAACQGLKKALNPASRAHDDAVEALREKADRSRDDVAGILRDIRPGEDVEAYLGQVKLKVERDSSNTGTVFGGPTAAGGRLRLDVAFVAKGQAGGGLSYETVTLRACVRMEGRAGRAAAVSMRDVRCPPNLPDYDEKYGTVSGVAKVAD